MIPDSFCFYVQKNPCFTLDVSAPSENQRVDTCGGAETEVSVNEIIPVKWATQCVWWAGCCGAGGGRAGHPSADAGEEVSWMNFDLLPSELLSPCFGWEAFILWEHWALRQDEFVWQFVCSVCCHTIISLLHFLHFWAFIAPRSPLTILFKVSYKTI